MFFIPIVAGGIAATYLHKKFPGPTEAVAKGVTKATVWVLKTGRDVVLKAADAAPGAVAKLK
jgi:hypothetical protein